METSCWHCCTVYRVMVMLFITRQKQRLVDFLFDHNYVYWYLPVCPYHSLLLSTDLLGYKRQWKQDVNITNI